MNLNSDNTPSWVYNSSYYYWTMSMLRAGICRILVINMYGGVLENSVWNGYFVVVRPVVTFSKSAL